ncbi:MULTISPECIES: flavin reductase family protein [unclassified Sphingobacterium]|uniref:flavin reductase family protein n=1 Tax=unclassified Sphingobacterium TaxID=2609468 RepID=UPI00104F33D1|nr:MULTISPECIES: flavin reductase family protein [unclassified Sphingobacterium]MCS3556837.1 flavin reductase (DIM6/NTAB) family NADH-FMN oxidoreductase RutF [Sphingobacterium sp. JUb21]TCQ99237.1 flavin reductase (DIM6/NTAB) family NADH-FMN oxidoreductase RutF [Sphingobacterium sp. JUb20]
MTTEKTTVIDPVEQQAIFDNLIKYAVAPRPICFASTIDAAGNVNLSPFSYFNFMSQQPPICVFSPLRRMRDGSTKHTLDNMLEVPEVVINIVNYSMVQQQSLASTEYGKGINEFDKSGFTAIASDLINPPRVAESPVQLECKVHEIINLGDGPGAGNLVIAEIVRMHIHENLLNDKNEVSQESLDLVARLGGNWYSRVTKESLFEVPKPLRNLGIGVDALPEHIRYSDILTGNQLGRLANVEQLPVLNDEKTLLVNPEIIAIWEQSHEDLALRRKLLQMHAAKLLDQGELISAWQILLLAV